MNIKYTHKYICFIFLTFFYLPFLLRVRIFCSPPPPLVSLITLSILLLLITNSLILSLFSFPYLVFFSFHFITITFVFQCETFKTFFYLPTPFSFLLLNSILQSFRDMYIITGLPVNVVVVTGTMDGLVDGCCLMPHLVQYYLLLLLSSIANTIISLFVVISIGDVSSHWVFILMLYIVCCCC